MSVRVLVDHIVCILDPAADQQAAIGFRSFEFGMKINSYVTLKYVTFSCQGNVIVVW